MDITVIEEPRGRTALTGREWAEHVESLPGSFQLVVGGLPVFRYPVSAGVAFEAFDQLRRSYRQPMRVVAASRTGGAR